MSRYAHALALEDSAQYRTDVGWGFQQHPVIVAERKKTDKTKSPKYRSAASESQAEFEKEFSLLVDQWTKDVQYTSSLTDMVAHDAYLKIISKGPRVVPLLLRELNVRPHFWFAALRAITNEDPVTEAERGDVQAMVDAWIGWGRERQYRQD